MNDTQAPEGALRAALQLLTLANRTHDYDDEQAASVAAVNLLRDHGPAILAALTRPSAAPEPITATEVRERSHAAGYHAHCEPGCAAPEPSAGEESR